MIRVACPRCAERLLLDDETAGLTGQCPECDMQFRIPAARVQIEARTRPSDDSAHVFEPASPQPRHMPLDYEQRRVRPRRRKRRRQVPLDISFLIVLAVLGGIALFTLVLVAIAPSLAIVAVIIGGLIAIVGNIWFLLYAFNESLAWGLGCLLIPFVSLIFLVQHFDDTWRPFAVSTIGGTVLLFGSMMAPAPVVSQPWPNRVVVPHGR